MDWEDRLREIDLPAPPTATRRALLREAARRQSGRRRAAILRWATATLVAVLIAVNVVVGSLQEQKLATMIGPVQGTSATQLAKALRARDQLLTESLGGVPAAPGGEQHDDGPISDLPSSGPRPA